MDEEKTDRFVPPPLRESGHGLDFEALFAFEEKLNCYPYRGVPLGTALSQNLYLNVFLGTRPYRWTSQIKICFKILFRLIAGISRDRSVRRLPSGKLIINLQDDKERFRGLVAPVVNQLERDAILLLSKSPAQTPPFPEGIESVLWSQVNRFRGARISWDFLRRAPRYFAILIQYLARFRYPKMYAITLFYDLMMGSLYVKVYRRFLEETRPAGILVEFDRWANISIFLFEAKRQGIPAFTMTHGVLNPPYGYAPLVADYAFAWGPRQREQYIEMGAMPDRVLIAGHPGLDRKIFADREVVRKRLGLSRDIFMVLLATSAGAPEMNRRQIEDLGKAVESQKKIHCIIRLHPAEERDSYGWLSSRYPFLSLLESEEFSRDEALAASDLIVIGNSGFGYEAMIKRRPVVVHCPENERLSAGKELVKEAGTPLTTDANSLHHLLVGFMEGRPAPADLLARQDEYVGRLIQRFGKDAAEYIVGMMRDILDGREHKHEQDLKLENDKK